MSDHERTSTVPAEASAEGAEVLQFPRTRESRRFRLRFWRRRKRPKRFKVRKLRVLAVFFFLGILAIVSALFGMFMAVASDLPPLEEPAHQPSVIVDARGREIGTLTGNERRIYLSETQIAPVMKHAIVAIEDRRFYTNSGVDLRGIARAAVEDVTSGGAVQGASTIPQQFVKISLAAENQRTVFQKLREAALAYHLTRKWSKERILRNYLNSIYFGNGAYGIESAARTYFAYNHDGCGGREDDPPCASVLLPHEAALLAAMVASPSAFDPTQHPVAAKRRRDLVLLRMTEQGYLTHDIYLSEKAEPLPTRDDLTFPKEDTEYPYFTSWIKQQVVDRLGGGQQGAQLAFEGGLRVKTTIDSRLQTAAQKAIDAWLPNKSGPRASLVAISNKDGAVRAMIGGDNYGVAPFNLATQGQRQPGSSFKPFVLAEALKQGISPNSTWESKKLTYTLKGGERFTVNNYDDAYAGVTTLANATAFSDNAVFVQVGKKVGTKKVSKLARRMGIRTPVSTNLAIALGGLRTGVTPLDMAHAYETFASGGKLIYGSLSPGQSKHSLPVPGPVGIERIDRLRNNKTKLVELPDGERMINKVKKRTVIKPEIANEVGQLLQGVVKKGSATRAQIPGVMIAGKTGTTENYGDAWFVGWTKEYTVAVWVGYPDEFKPMKTEFQGAPVAGGTFPAGIWKTFMESLLKYDPLPKKDGGDGTGKDLEPTPSPSGDGSGTPPPAATVAPPASTTAPPATGGGTGGTGNTTPQQTPTPQATTPPAATPPPQATPPPANPGTDPGGTTGGGGQTAPPAGGDTAAATTG
ncbi:transglycosylase domain-containing protein [Solirubrobacter ginsenosidimutans]|uniref:Transglycosylase domain-containing protein n=1 Tax=Solirubrobacter ginsenosidimutans TaxID=490573 RepID=A0A9X3S3R0_9ACTN|nr:transglycosylase domain-containing protein [Solirubrobacter ginsenosidimutans]MDA0163712.1 transglycosylase domain-containing protein [Solirubrobacter ginsenosidimutans]